MQAPGAADFDPLVVGGIASRSPEAIDVSPGGGLRCPLVGHDHWLPWQDKDYERGTTSHGEPALSFRSSPTYVLDDPGDNFIVGLELLESALSGSWGKAEVHRLGHENSEDALTWNVFRSLQEAGHLRLAAEACGVPAETEPELVLWGRRVGLTATEPCEEMAAALDLMEPHNSQQTEPDIALHVAGWGWIFIEAKLASPTSTYKRTPERLDAWIERYAEAGALFDIAALKAAEPEKFPEQLLRNVAIAAATRKPGENVAVVALVREAQATALDSWGTGLVNDATVECRIATWEQLYRALSPNAEAVAPLRRYMRQKTVRLRPAFSIPSDDT